MRLPTSAALTNSVILNLFQDPFLRTSGLCGDKQIGGMGTYPAGSELAARWALKQVQGDDAVNGALRG